MFHLVKNRVSTCIIWNSSSWKIWNRSLVKCRLKLLGQHLHFKEIGDRVYQGASNCVLQSCRVPGRNWKGFGRNEAVSRVPVSDFIPRGSPTIIRSYSEYPYNIDLGENHFTYLKRKNLKHSEREGVLALVDCDQPLTSDNLTPRLQMTQLDPSLKKGEKIFCRKTSLPPPPPAAFPQGKYWVKEKIIFRYETCKSR